MPRWVQSGFKALVGHYTETFGADYLNSALRRRGNQEIPEPYVFRTASF